MDREQNMTEGNPFKLILAFSIPLIVGNLGQQLYMIVDAIIVGRGVGVDGLASVGATDWTYWLFLWTVQAVTQGFSIFIAQDYGMGDITRLKKTLAMSLGMSFVLGIVFTAVGIPAISPILNLLKTPEDILAGAKSYLNILLGGLVVVMAYNMVSAILRAFGDGRTPLIAMVIAALTNIILDLIFVMVFRWGIVGAALATVIAQFIAFGYCMILLCRKDVMKLNKEDWKPDWSRIGRLGETGFSLAITQVLIAIGGMVLQSAINFQGSLFVAGFTAANKLLGLLESSAISLGYAVTTYMAQNFGARLFDRLRKGIRAALAMGVGISVFISVMMVLAGKPILGLFIDSSNPHADAVLKIAYHYLLIMSCMLSFLYILHILRSALPGIGCEIAAVIAGFMEFGARVSIALYFSRIFGKSAVFFAEPFAWICAVAALIGMSVYRFHQLPQN